VKVYNIWNVKGIGRYRPIACHPNNWLDYVGKDSRVEFRKGFFFLLDKEEKSALLKDLGRFLPVLARTVRIGSVDFLGFNPVVPSFLYALFSRNTFREVSPKKMTAVSSICSFVGRFFRVSRYYIVLDRACVWLWALNEIRPNVYRFDTKFRVDKHDSVIVSNKR